jgi:hypothetical protein
MEMDAQVRAVAERCGFIRECVWLEFECAFGGSSMVPPETPSPADDAAGWRRALITRAPERGPVVNKPLRPRLPPVATGPFRNVRIEGWR